MKTNKTFFLLLAFLLACLWSEAQSDSKQANPPAIRDFTSTLQFLASPELEGRETGTRGGTIAANYVAAMMQKTGLKPYQENSIQSKSRLSDYYQSFSLLRFHTGTISFEINSLTKKHKPYQLLLYKDFTLKNVFQDVSINSTVVVAGYGINSPALGYNDYAGLDVKGKLVIVFDGYPGQHDTLSATWQKFRAISENDSFNLEMKCREATRQSAAAILVISKDYLNPITGNSSKKKDDETDETPYLDAEYLLPGNTNNLPVPCFLLTQECSHILSDELKIDFSLIEQTLAQQLNITLPVSKNIFTIKLLSTTDTLPVHNVVGILQGKDTSQTVILGAHYDHLGKRGKTIFNGSDDNASGVAGLLALAEMWTKSHTTPPCNIMFASWTAEEKGLIGSEYFASKLKNPEKVKLYINMDMISRSVKEDTAGRQLSIGTRIADEYLRELASRSNSTLSHPFTLDLWDVTGHSGSDYASFTAKNIPVMTYNTGLHDDYHTPRDIPASADLVKMEDVLKLINNSLQEVLENISGK